MRINPEEYAYYIRPGVTDMRKCTPSLSRIVQDQMRLEPFGKSVFLFCGRNRRTVKAILWDGNGWLEIAKRLECGESFKWPESEKDAMGITVAQVEGMLRGNDVWREFPVFTPKLVG
jgi:transposase